MSSRATKSAPDGAEGVASAAPEAAAEQPVIDTSPLDAVLDLLGGITAKLDAQATKIAQLEAQQASAPRMVAMDATIQPHTGPQAAPQLHGPGEGIDQERTLPHGVDSHELPDQVISNFPRFFDAGDPVRIRPEFQREDCPKTWGEILEGCGKQGRIRCNLKNRRFPKGCPGTVTVGEACPVCHVGPHVKKAMFLNPNGHWIYKVWVNGLTSPQGQSFEQRELEAIGNHFGAYQ